MYNKSHNYRLNPISDTLQLVWQIVSLKSLSLQLFGRDGRGDGRGGGALSLLFGMNLENPSAQRPRSGHRYTGNPDTADGIAMGTGPLTTISYSREEKRAISPQSVCLPLFAFFEIFSHILVLSSSLSLAFPLSLILIWIICLFTFTRHI